MNKINFITGENIKIDNFPDGEKHLNIENIDRKYPIDITIRIKDSNDIFYLLQLLDIVKRQELEANNIYIPYLIGMRMDRVIDYNGSFTLKVISNIINQFNAIKVIIDEPHSDKTLSLINNSEPKRTLYDLYIKGNSSYTICFPDKGALDRNIYGTINQKEYLYCEKQRDANGILRNFKICNPEIFKGGDILIFDDLCDGGGTFIGIHNLLKELPNVGNIDLAITHLVNPTGKEKIMKTFNKVYTTNSYDNYKNEENLTVTNIL